MPPIRSSAFPLAVALACALTAPLGAQAVDARVASPGVARVQVGGTYATFGERFGSPADPGSADRRAAAAPFAWRLTPENFAPLATLQAGLAAFLAGDTDPDALQPSAANLFFATREIQGVADSRGVPVAVELGVLPRVSVAVRGGITRHRLTVAGFGIGGGTIGVNPDPAANAAALAAIDSTFRPLGAGRFLPTAGSPLGIALQERARARGMTGALVLPTDPVGDVRAPGLSEAAAGILATGVYAPTQALWGPADLEVAARFELLNTTDGAAPGTAAGAGIRAAVEAGVRLPTGRRPTANFFVLPAPEEGVSGWSVAAAADLFASPRYGAAVSGRWESLGEVTLARPFWEAGVGTLPPPIQQRTGRWNPGTRISVEATPHFRLADEISLFGRYAVVRRSGERYIGFEEVGVPGGEVQRTSQAWGVGAQFSTIPTAEGARIRTPFEARIQVLNAFAGRDGAPAIRMVEMEARAFVRLWGRDPRP